MAYSYLLPLVLECLTPWRSSAVLRSILYYFLLFVFYSYLSLVRERLTSASLLAISVSTLCYLLHFVLLPPVFNKYLYILQIFRRQRIQIFDLFVLGTTTTLRIIDFTCRKYFIYHIMYTIIWSAYEFFRVGCLSSLKVTKLKIIWNKYHKPLILVRSLFMLTNPIVQLWMIGEKKTKKMPYGKVTWLVGTPTFKLIWSIKGIINIF